MSEWAGMLSPVWVRLCSVFTRLMRELLQGPEQCLGKTARLLWETAQHLAVGAGPNKCHSPFVLGYFCQVISNLQRKSCRKYCDWYSVNFYRVQKKSVNWQNLLTARLEIYSHEIRVSWHLNEVHFPGHLKILNYFTLGKLSSVGLHLESLLWTGTLFNTMCDFTHMMKFFQNHPLIWEEEGEFLYNGLK